MRASACPTQPFPIVNDGFRSIMGIEAVETISLADSITIVAVFLKHDTRLVGAKKRAFLADRSWPRAELRVLE